MKQEVYPIVAAITLVLSMASYRLVTVTVSPEVTLVTNKKALDNQFMERMEVARAHTTQKESP